MIRVVIFDFDGLILDTEVPLYQAWQEVFQQYGCELPLDRWVAAIGLGSSNFDPYRCLQEHADRPIDIERVRQSYRARNRALVLEQSVRPGVVDYLRAAEQMGLQVGMASSSPRSWILPHLQRLGISSYFSHIRCADDVQRTKPDPEVYQAVLSTFDIHAHQAVALEDSQNGVAAAMACGIFCVAVPNPLTRHLPFTNADLRIASLTDIALLNVVQLAEQQYEERGDSLVSSPAHY